MKRILLVALATTLCTLQGENDKNSSEEKHQQLPQGAYFSFTNVNSQNLEERRTKVTRSKNKNQPPIIIYAQPQQQLPSQQPLPQPQSGHVYKEPAGIQQPLIKSNEPSHFQYYTHDCFTSSFAKIKEIPRLFTAKNCLIALGTVACSYAALYFILMHHVKNAKKNRGWGSFQEHIPPNDLSSLEQLALADGIIEEIKTRYPLINPVNLMPSLLLFNKDIEQELEELNSFINFYTWIMTYKLALFFPNQEKLMHKAQTKIQRLHIVQDAITEWINIHVVRLMRNQPIPRQDNLTTRSDEAKIIDKNHNASLLHE